MKLGEALALRARQAQDLDALRGRIKANTLAQEGEEPTENVDDLMAEFVALSADHSTLVAAIAVTNHSAVTSEGELLATALHRREHLRRQRNIYEMAAVSGTPNAGNMFRYTRTELATRSTVRVPDLRQKVKEKDAEIRKLDAEIQTTNWVTDLAT